MKGSTFDVEPLSIREAISTYMPNSKLNKRLNKLEGIAKTAGFLANGLQSWANELQSSTTQGSDVAPTPEIVSYTIEEGGEDE